MTRLLAGRYRLLRELGRGGMGVVWRARDEHLGRDVAIKEASALAGHQTHTTLRRALREGRVCARLNHPGIVGVHDIIDHDDRPWIVMELINGRSLADQIEQDGPMPEQRAADLGLQLLDALNAVHRKGITHRDIKPANIMMDGDRAVLTDFGIALEPAGTTQSEPNQLIGSPEYLAPERIDGQPASPASDLWALGVTLYTAVHGTSPFARSDLPTTLAAVLAFDPPPPPRAHRLWPVIHRLLNKNPAERLTAEHTAKQLRSVRDAPPTASADIARTVTVTAPVPATRPRRGRLTTGALAVLGLASLVVWLEWNQNEAAPSSTPSASTTSSSPAAPTSTAPSAPQGFMLYQDDHGFAIAMPADWDNDPYRPNNWYGLVVATTTLQLDANRVMPDQPGTTAIAYLSDHEKTSPWQTGPYSNTRNLAYQRISLTEQPASAGANTVAVLEYLLSYNNQNGSTVAVHKLVSAFVTDSGEIYTVELRVAAEAPQTISQTWQDVLPTVTTILNSFRIT
jgi:serine/threonine protein kinase